MSDNQDHSHHDHWAAMLDRIQALTGLSGRDAAKVAVEFEEDSEPLPQEIVDKARELGFDVEAKHGASVRTEQEPIGPEITMDPAVVLTEVYENCPRVLCAELPVLGKAPDEARANFGELIDEMPDEMRAMLVKIDQFEGKATFWLRDEANDIDRPIGPIDLTRYDSERALIAAFEALMTRLSDPRPGHAQILTADFN